MGAPQEWGWVISIAIAIIPALLAVVGVAVGREARAPRPLRSLNHLAGTLEKLPADSASFKSVDALVSAYVDSVSSQIVQTRKLNKFNVGMTTVLVVLSALAMFGLIQWIIAAPVPPWSVVAWAVTAVAALFFIVLNAAAATTIYNPPTPKKDKRAESSRRSG